MLTRQQLLPAVACVTVVLFALSWAYISPSHRLPGAWGILSDTMGVVYTAAWSYSFYPQMILNYRRKSVEGLSLDFQMLNLLGFACYSTYNVALAYVPAVRAEYVDTFSKSIPVGFEDVAFAVHAFFATVVVLVQCHVYDRGDQSFFTPVGRTTMLLGAICAAGGGAVAAAQASGAAQQGSMLHILSWVHLLLALSAVKLLVSLIKYIPQVSLNAKRSSTEGWSITNVLLDFTGGTLSVSQLLLQCTVLNDWTQIAGNPVKFGLGFVALSFDIIFMLQHFVWYVDNEQPGRCSTNREEEASILAAEALPQGAQAECEDAKGDTTLDAM